MSGQPFDLRITLTGLCMYVPEREPRDRRRLHVLLPRADGHHAHDGIDEHACRLMWNSKYENGIDENAWSSRNLAGQELRLDAPTRKITLDIPEEFIPLADICDVGEVDLDAAMPKLSAWVNFDTGAMYNFAEPTCWQVPRGSAARPLTHQAEWVIPNVSEDRLQGWSLRALDGSGSVGLPTLRPVGGEVRLYVYHVPPHEIPATPSEEPKSTSYAREATHFLAYYSLLKTPPTGKRPVPWRHASRKPTPDNPCDELEPDPVHGVELEDAALFDFPTIESQNCMGCQATLA